MGYQYRYRFGKTGVKKCGCLVISWCIIELPSDSLCFYLQVKGHYVGNMNWDSLCCVNQTIRDFFFTVFIVQVT